MILDPVSTVLICGMGSHARSVLIYMDHYAVRTVYIVRSKYNTPEFDTIADRLFRDIKNAIKLADHPVAINDTRVNEREFLQSFESIARVYDRHKHEQIITDITAGHKIISIMLLQAHTMSRHKFQHEDKIVYLYENADTPVEIPSIDVTVPASAIIGLLRDVDYYYSHQFERIKTNETRQEEWTRPATLSYHLNHGPTITGNRYSNVDIHRLKKKATMLGLMDLVGHVTLKGRMWISINTNVSR